jgi:hypothetical protein
LIQQFIDIDIVGELVEHLLDSLLLHGTALSRIKTSMHFDINTHCTSNSTSITPRWRGGARAGIAVAADRRLDFLASSVLGFSIAHERPRVRRVGCQEGGRLKNCPQGVRLWHGPQERQRGG